MKINHSFFNYINKIIIVTLLSLPLTVFAGGINLYEQPKPDAKVVATIDLSSGVIPIYTPKGDWIKVADPKNGNVGWVRSNDLNHGSPSQSTFTFTQSISKDNNTPITYRIIQFRQPTNLTPEQKQFFIKQDQLKQEVIQKSMQNMLDNMNKVFYDEWSFMHDHFPVFMPIMVVPVQKNANVAQPPGTTKTSVPLKPAKQGKAIN